MADEVMRNEKWRTMKAKANREQTAGFDSQKPWDFVIRASRWGAEETFNHHWWSLHVLEPLRKGPTQVEAQRKVHELER